MADIGSVRLPVDAVLTRGTLYALLDRVRVHETIYKQAGAVHGCALATNGHGASEIDSITVDWDVNAAAVKTRAGIERFDEKTAKRVVTTGCGQGTVFGDLMGELDSIRLPAADEPSARISQSALYGLLNAMRVQESTYKSAGSVHGCALFKQDELLMFVEDVGRHNAIDTIAGWMWLNDVTGGDKIFYTTGRLTSEMVIKSAQMGVPIIVSRSGITQMGHQLAVQLGLALFGRAMNKHFICYSGFDRFDSQPEPRMDRA